MTKRYLILFVALFSLAAWARQLTPQQALQRLNLNNARSMAGSRIGYAIGDPKLIKYLNDCKYSFNSYGE